ncbi:MAG: asparagine synthase (glutamine-hydrolyzing) [Fibrobacteres bacterium]|nr:asparagine synthase (glutamine-hydrolyzing) [Fibrobacterota bacterium]
MCSIAGLIYKNESITDINIEAMNHALKHRGPDASDYYRDDNVALLHNRLSILDLSVAGAQPMTSSCGRFVLCYNGEIYNHLELRTKLNHPNWRGHSDTETLVELLADLVRKDGDIATMLNEFNGMFAFALWDKETRKLVLVRDRFGVKPLFIYQNNGMPLAFASEIKAFKNAGLKLTKRDKALSEYMTYGHMLAGSSYYSEISQLNPGTILTISTVDNEIVEKQYWKIPTPKRYVNSYEKAVDELDALISDSIKIRLISDVPYGVFLSGGIDSSLITAIMQKHHNSPIKTFSVGFESSGKIKGHEYDELSAAALVSKHVGTEHNEVIVRPQDIVDNIDAMAASYDQPFADPAAFPTWFLSRFTSKHVKVVLTGEGADELFGGYRRYRAHMWGTRNPILAKLAGNTLNLVAKTSPALRKTERMARAFSSTEQSRRYSLWMEPVAERTRKILGHFECLDNRYNILNGQSAENVGNELLRLDQATWMVDDYLEKVDKATMAFSLEGREPFLDYRLAEFANSLPIEWKAAKRSKMILRDVASRYIPSELVNRPKHGFAVPLREWFRNELYDFARLRFEDAKDNFEENGIKMVGVNTVLKEHKAGVADHTGALWLLLVCSATNK